MFQEKIYGNNQFSFPTYITEPAREYPLHSLFMDRFTKIIRWMFLLMLRRSTTFSVRNEATKVYATRWLPARI